MQRQSLVAPAGASPLRCSPAVRGWRVQVELTAYGAPQASDPPHRHQFTVTSTSAEEALAAPSSMSECGLTGCRSPPSNKAAIRGDTRGGLGKNSVQSTFEYAETLDGRRALDAGNVERAGLLLAKVKEAYRTLATLLPNIVDTAVQARLRDKSLQLARDIEKIEDRERIAIW